MLIHFTTFCVFMIFSSAWMILYTLPETSQPTAMKPPLKIPRANAPKRKLHLPPNPRKFQVQPTLGMEKTNSWDGKKTFPWFTSNPAPVFNRHRTFKNPTPFPKEKIILTQTSHDFWVPAVNFQGFHVLFQFSSGNIKALLLTSGFSEAGVIFLHPQHRFFRQQW